MDASPDRVTLDRLTLTDFRTYPALTWRPGTRIAVITGPNGSGKTNLLEAISLLAPGRGLRAARGADLRRHGSVGGWGVHAHLVVDGMPREIGTGSPAEGSDRRVFRLDGAAPRTQAEVARACACVWLTPQMDRLFGESASGRRRFLDRLAWALEPSHAREVAAHDTAMSSRNRLLARGGADPAWLAGLEDSMARHAVAVAAARASLVARLNTALAGGAAGGFPPARLDLLDPVAERLAASPALLVEDWLRDALAASRSADAAAGGAGLGAHRADMGMADLHSGLPAALGSTGQQKSLLIGTVLGHAALIADARGTAPMLLLDEPAVHLDEGRRAALWAALQAGTGPVFITGTDAGPMAALRAGAAFYEAGDGQLRPA